MPTAAMTSKTIPQLKQGDVVAFHGATFRIVADAAPLDHHMVGVFGCYGEVIEQGTFPSPYLERSGYGLRYRFQGNELRTVTLIEGN